MTAPLAVSLGDPAGVGPELIATIWALHNQELRDAAPFFVVGGAGVLDRAFARRGFDKERYRTRVISDPGEVSGVFAGALPVLGADDCRYRPGEPSDEGAQLALRSLTEAARLTVSGAASGLVTGPVSKAWLAKAGFAHPGQTEFVAEACGYDACDTAMMLAGPSLRTIPVTVHLPLADVAGVLASATIERKGRIAAMALMRDFGIARPRLAVAALNPHAGEDGRMGNEEARIIAPAIAALRAEGIDITGPHAADALFAPRRRETYDAALCMYHDQALIPLKALDFDSGVNVTLGLPIVRTSPDHGTAFDIAGTGKAHPGAMIAAIRMAAQCAARRSRA